MTTPEVEIAETPPSPHRSRVFEIVSWLVIVAFIGVVVLRNARVQPPGDVQELMDEQRARMVGLMAVQLKALSSGENNPLAAQTKETQAQLIRDLEREAQTPEDFVRVIVLIGEVQGGDAAIAAFGKVAPEARSPEITKDLETLQTIYGAAPDALVATDRDRLVKRYAAMGRIALSYGVPSDKEPRKSIQSESLVLMVRVAIVGLGFLAMALASVVLVILGCVWFFRGKLRPAYAPEPLVGSVLLEGFAIYLTLFLGLGLFLRLLRLGSLQWMWLALLILPVIFAWAAWRGVSVDQVRKALGWHRGRGFLWEVAAGLGGYIAGLGVILVGGIVTYLIVKYTGVRISSPIVQELRGSPLHVAGIYAVACVFAPFMEETMFRGALFHHLRQRWGWAVSAPVVAFIFAVIHPQGWVAVPALGAIALVLAALREWRGSLIAPMAAHAANNFLVLTVTLLVLE
jgi:membrane protease YdiL (CAAX protease family)